MAVEAHDSKAVLAGAAARLQAHQRLDGAFVFRCEVNPLPDAWMILLLCLTDRGSDPLIPHLSRRLLRAQRGPGVWAGYDDQTDTLSMTAIAYLALRLCGHPPSASYMNKAKHHILDYGGLAACSNLTRIMLAVAGQVPWTSLPSGHIEVMCLHPEGFINLYDFAAFTRLHLVPYMILSRLQYCSPHARSGLMPELQSCRIAHLVSQASCLVDHGSVQKCVDFILQRMEPNGTLASYLTATTLAVFALQAAGYPSHHPVIERAITGLKQMVHVHGKDAHQQLFTSTVWDTALAMRALQAVAGDGATGVLARGRDYLLSRQHRLPSDWRMHNPDVRPGGWGFSDVNTLFPDVDDTAAALWAITPYRVHFPDAWRRGFAWLLSMQNRDGGWSAFDKNCNKWWIEYLPINDMGRAMTDPSTADLTGRVLELIGTHHLQASKAVRKGVHYLLEHQLNDGNWFGRWGIAYIYGTWAALCGLRASGLPPSHPALVKARGWLETVQNPDGGFGESCASDTTGQYMPLGRSIPSQTAWGLMGLLAAAETCPDSAHRAAARLVAMVHPAGGWRETYPTGAGVAEQAYLRYHSYPLVWPLIALDEYLCRVRLVQGTEHHPE